MLNEEYFKKKDRPLKKFFLTDVQGREFKYEGYELEDGDTEYEPRRRNTHIQVFDIRDNAKVDLPINRTIIKRVEKK